MWYEDVCALTHGSAARLGSGSGDLLSGRVDAPALIDAGVTLQGFVSAVSITAGHVLTGGRTRTEEEVSFRWRRGCLGCFSVPLTRRLLSFCSKHTTSSHCTALYMSSRDATIQSVHGSIRTTLFASVLIACTSVFFTTKNSCKPLHTGQSLDFTCLRNSSSERGIFSDFYPKYRTNVCFIQTGRQNLNKYMSKFKKVQM